MKWKGVLNMGRKHPKDCWFIPPWPGSSPVNNNNDNHLKIEIDHAKCCPVPECPCESGELIKNGGFELLSADQTQTFAHWKAVNPQSNTIVSQAPIGMVPVAYEGIRSAWFITEPSETEQHSISLQQNITVTPGCIYQFSFAENLLTASVFSPSLTGRVFYTDNAGNQFDLISISIRKSINTSNFDRGYTFHQETADIPVPCDVSKVTIQFDFSVRDSGGTIWLLDGVSLRSIASASSCSGDGCTYSGDICKTGNLVRNGDFEDITGGPGSPFLYWRQLPETNDQAFIEFRSDTPYEGNFAAIFISSATANDQLKRVSLRQIVTVTPGCRLELSFAENFLERGESSGDTPRLTGRVFWVNDSGTEFDLINIPIVKINAESDVDKGYSFHKRTADVPVPCNVSSVYVQFEFSVTNTGNTQWLLDSVQLRAVPWESVCCQALKEVNRCAEL
jgi:hypothetical protein